MQPRFPTRMLSWGPITLSGTAARLVACLGAALLLAARPAPAAAAEEAVTFYVSPTGNDGWSGKVAEARPDRSDGPFATVARARDAARAVRGQGGGNAKQPVTISLRGGTYFLTEPLALSPEDSGTEAQPLTISASPGEHPVLSGGRRVTGWRVSNESGHEVWTARLPEGLPAGPVHALWVDGGRRVRSRYPAKGYLKVASGPTAPGEKKPANKKNEKGETEFHFRGDDLKAWPDVNEAELVLMSKWVDNRLPVTAVDGKDHVVRFSKGAVQPIDAGDLYFLEGPVRFLESSQEPGQWGVDAKSGAKSGTIRYLPLPGEKPEAVEAVVPALDQVLRLEGKPEGHQFVDHVVFRGITFAHTRCELPDHDARGNTPGPAGFHQAAIGATAAVFGQGALHCTFDHCTVEHTGGYGIELAGGCRHDKLTGCTVTDLGAGGIKIGEQQMRGEEAWQTFGNEVSDCRVTDGGLLYPSGVGVWVGQSYDDLLSHNEVADFYYTAFSVGWRWGYAKASTHGVVVEHNDIHHIGVKHSKQIGGALDGPILSDMGGIYTLGPQAGSVVRNNRFHDIAAIKYGGWGIYFDEGSTDILAEKNLVYRTTHGGLHQHYGKDNIFHNNVIAFGRDWQVQRTRPEEHRSFTFERNLVYWDSGIAVSGNWTNLNAGFDHNVYWAFGKGEMKFGGMTWEQWREKGMDADSLHADPGFVDPEKGDFRLKERGGAAEKVGFEPFDMNDVGPRR